MSRGPCVLWGHNDLWTTNSKYVFSWVQMDVCDKFEYIPSRHSWDIAFTKMGCTTWIHIASGHSCHQHRGIKKCKKNKNKNQVQAQSFNNESIPFLNNIDCFNTYRSSSGVLDPNFIHFKQLISDLTHTISALLLIIGKSRPYLSINARNLCLYVCVSDCVCLKYLCRSGSDWPEIFNMGAIFSVI